MTSTASNASGMHSLAGTNRRDESEGGNDQEEGKQGVAQREVVFISFSDLFVPQLCQVLEDDWRSLARQRQLMK